MPSLQKTLHGDVRSFALYGLRMGMDVAVEDNKPHVLGLLLVLLVSNVAAVCSLQLKNVFSILQLSFYIMLSLQL